MGAVGRGELGRSAAGRRNLEQAARFENAKEDSSVLGPGAARKRSRNVADVGQCAARKIERLQLVARGESDRLTGRRPKWGNGGVGPRKEAGLGRVQRPNPDADTSTHIRDEG